MATTIKHVQGNRIELSFPLVIRNVLVEDGQTTTNEITPIFTGEATVRLSKGSSTKIDIPCTVSNNLIIMTDEGTIPVGTWSIELRYQYSEGYPLRHKYNALLQVVDATADGGQYDNNEFDVVACYPVMNVLTSGIVITDDEVVLTVGGSIGTDTDGDDEATLNATYGAGSIVETDDEIVINI